MITQETLKRIYKYGLIAAVIIGVIFAVFALFINRGTLTVVTKAPFIVEIERFESRICTQDECSVTLAPGDYTITVKKEGYKDLTKDVTVPIGSETREEAELVFIPVVRDVDPEEDVRVFGIPVVDMDQFKDTEPYFDENYVVYLARSKENGRQTIYIAPLQTNTSTAPNAPDFILGEPVVATSFIRNITDYEIYPFIISRNKIVFVDKTGGRSSLYVIDLAEKTRDSVITYPAIDNVKWLPETDDFIFEARAENEMQNVIYWYQSGSVQAIKINIDVPLAWVEPLDSQTLIAATNQLAVGPAETGDLIGSLVNLSAEKSNITNFVIYDLVTGNTRLLAITDVFYDLEEAKIRPDKKGVYLLQGAKIFELMLGE
jgi:hypothetical protein